MKKLLLLCLGCVIAMNVFAQDTVKKTNRIGDFNEEFMVLKSNKKMRQGTYQLFYQKKLAAIGKYDQGKRTGVWSYYRDGNLVQQYDFTGKKMISMMPEKEITYTINADQSQAVTAPVAIGGLNAGLRLIASYTDYASNLSELKGHVTVIHSVSIDNEGKIVKWTSMFKSADGLKVVNPSFTDIPDDLILFTPATTDKNNVASVISFQDAEQTGSANDVTVETKTQRKTATSGRSRN